MWRPHLRIPPRFLNMPHAPIAHPNRLAQAFHMSPLQRLPHRLPIPVGSVHQEEVHISAPCPKLLYAIRNARVRPVHAARGAQYLGGQKDLLAGDFALSDGLADLGFVAVELGGVDVAVAALEGLQA